MNRRERSMQRSACDRCHGQKLRCIRGPLPNGPCQRCIKAREKCQYGPTLRLGRPANNPNSEAKSGSDAKETSTVPATNTVDHWPAEPAVAVSATTGSDRPTEEDAPTNFPQLGIEAHVFPTTTPVFPPLPGINQTLHGAQTDPAQFLSSDCIMDDDDPHFMQEWAQVLDSQITNVASCSNVPPLINPGGNLAIDVLPTLQYTNAEQPHQPNAQNDAQRQLSELLKSLYDRPSPTRSNACSNLQQMVETVRAANTLLSIITSLEALETTVSIPSPLPEVPDAADSYVDADTVFLVAACYSRIFRNSNAMAVVLHDAVSSNDMDALQSMPSIKIGSMAPFPTMSPTIQSALWVQLLRQSLRELEKRLLALSRPTTQSPSAPHASLRPRNKSHVADLARSIDADVAGLEVGVNHLLKTTLDMLR
ncbi:MAG: hypothetical protein Q9227_001064 [Pyrenula ochraceoflavens]